MSRNLFIGLSALTGIVTGFLTIHSPLTHSWLSIFVWILVGLVIVYFAPDRKTAMYAASLFGFFDIASWLISGFQGARSAIGGFAMLVLILSVLGAVCGLGGAYIFSRLSKKP